MITGIEADLAIERTPKSDEIIQIENGLFDYLPATVHAPLRFKNAIEKVIDTVDEIKAICEAKDSNQYTAILTDLKRLETHFLRCANNPQRMHDVSLKMQRYLEREIKTGECPSDELITDLEFDVETGVTDIRKSNADVEKTVRSRLAVRLSSCKREEKERFGEAMLDAAKVSTERLGSETREDVAVSLDEVQILRIAKRVIIAIPLGVFEWRARLLTKSVAWWSAMI